MAAPRELDDDQPSPATSNARGEARPRPGSAAGSSRATVRTVAITIGMVLGTALALALLYSVRQVLLWMAIASFFAVALVPLVGWVQRRVTRGRRLPAVLLVFLVGLLLVAGLITLFAVPLTAEATRFATQLPHLIAEARTGNGVIGRLLSRTHALTYLQQNESRIRDFASGLTAPAAVVLQALATGVIGIITVIVLTVLIVFEAPKITRGALGFIANRSLRERVRRVSSDCARSITGYITGNLLISVLCGALLYGVLAILGIPFAGLIALFVAIADLVPIVGATLGGIVALIAAGFHSTPAVVVVAIFLVAYQQLENHILQPIVFSRTVKLNPLVVLIAILFGIELGGVLGALLGIPVAGVIQVIVRDLWDQRTGGIKDRPTVGEAQTPVARTHPAPSASPGSSSHLPDAEAV